MPSVTCSADASGIVMLYDTLPPSASQRRSPRIQLGGSVPALVMLEDGQRAKAKLQTVSVTGGLLRLAKSLSQGDFVEVAFQIQCGPVRGMAEMLSPVRAASEGSCSPSASSRSAMTTIAPCAWRWIRLRTGVSRESDPASGPRPNRSRSSPETYRERSCPVRRRSLLRSLPERPFDDQA